MAFNKFDPHRETSRADAAANASAERRSKMLKYGWWISVVYTAIGFGFIAYWLVT